MTSHVPEAIVCKEFCVPPLYGHSLAGATTAATPMAAAAACYGQCCDYGRACVSAYTSPVIPVNSFPYYPLPFPVSSAEGQRLQQRQIPVYPLYPIPQQPSIPHLNAKEREELAFAKATAEVNAVNAKNASSLSPLHDTSPGVPSMPFANAGPSGVCQMSYSSPGDGVCTGTGLVNGYGYGYAHGYGYGYGQGYGYNYGYNYGCGYGGPNNNAGLVI